MPTVPDIKKPNCNKTDDGRIIMSVDNVSSPDIIDRIIFSVTINNITYTNVVIVNNVNSGRIESIFDLYVDDNNIIDWNIISNTINDAFTSVRGYNIFINRNISDTIIVVGGSTKNRLGVIFTDKFSNIVKVYDVSGNAIILDDVVENAEHLNSGRDDIIELKDIDDGIIHTDSVSDSAIFVNSIDDEVVHTTDLADSIAIINVHNIEDDGVIFSHTIQSTDDVILTDDTIEVKGIITSSKY